MRSAQRAGETGQRREQIADEHDQSALAGQFHHAPQRRREVGAAALGGLFQRQHEVPQMPRPMPRRQVFAHRAVEGQQPDGVALLGQKLAERRGQRARIVGLGVAARAEAHRPAQVHEQVAAQVGLVLESLDEVAVGAPGELPVEIARIVARRVGPVLGELDREAVIRAAVQPVPEPLDHRARPQLEIADRHERRGVEQARGSAEWRCRTWALLHFTFPAAARSPCPRSRLRLRRGN